VASPVASLAWPQGRRTARAGLLPLPLRLLLRLLARLLLLLPPMQQPAGPPSALPAGMEQPLY
jgi:hypothetical protein